MTTAPPPEPAILRGWRGPTMVAVLLLAGLWHLRGIDRSMPPEKSDLQMVRIGVRSTLQGENPYSDLVTRRIQIAYYGRPLVPGIDQVTRMEYTYPVYTAIVLGFPAPLTFEQARMAFLIVMPCLMAVALLLWMRVTVLRIRPLQRAVLVAFALISWPVLWAMRLQQPTLIVVFLLAAGCYLLRQGQYASAGAALALSTIKPQLTLPLLLWLLCWACLHRRWRFPITLLASVAALLLTAHDLIPGWFSNWRQAGFQMIHHDGQHPVLAAAFGTWVGYSAMVTLAFAAMAALWRLRLSQRTTPQFGLSIGLVLATTIALLPTINSMIYNQVLLIPGCLALFHSKASLPKSIAIQFILWGFIAAPLAVVLTALHPSATWQLVPFCNAFLPVALAAVLIAEALNAEACALPEPPPERLRPVLRCVEFALPTSTR